MTKINTTRLWVCGGIVMAAWDAYVHLWWGVVLLGLLSIALIVADAVDSCKAGR
jgi:hypothetical protein